MTTPIYSLSDWAAAQASPWNGQNANARLIEALIRASVSDRDLTAPPGACADGAAYLVDTGATGAWATKDGQMAVAVGVNAASGWLFADIAREGFILWVDDENIRLEYRTDISPAGWTAFAGSGASSYDFGFVFEDTPAGGAILGRVRIGRDIDIPADFAGASGGGDTNPDADFAIDVQDDGASIGTITVSSAGAITWATTGGTAKVVAGGSEVLFIAPNDSPAESSIAGWSFVILATEV